jgi:hypothetical protein
MYSAPEPSFLVRIGLDFDPKLVPAEEQTVEKPIDLYLIVGKTNAFKLHYYNL